MILNTPLPVGEGSGEGNILWLTEKLVIQHVQMRRAPGEVRRALLSAGERIVVLLNRAIEG